MALVFGRSLWLGEPMSIPLHRLQNGALLLFTFFMISDPRTTPIRGRDGLCLRCWWRVAPGTCSSDCSGRTAAVVARDLFDDGSADRLAPAGTRYEWARPRASREPCAERGGYMKRLVLMTWLIVAACAVVMAQALLAFCGFYVAKADTKLFNKASQVVLVRQDDRTVLTMANDFKGDPKEFAMVIPVPTVLQKDQIHVGDKALLDHLDAYSAPRLVEYFDENPCSRIYAANCTRPDERHRRWPATRQDSAPSRSLGVTIEAQYTVGEYDILILSAQQSSGLETWLRENGYRIPPGAASVLTSYIQQNLKFFVAKVNLKEQAKLGYSCCGRFRSRTNHRNSCCRFAWGWSTRTDRRSCSSTR